MKALLCGLAFCFCTSCIVSTHEGLGQPPVVPLPPEDPVAAKEEATPPQEGPTQVAASHILISYKGATRAAPYIDRTKEDARMLAEELRAQALEGADFALLARENSDDRGSAATGGSLGTFRREQMVPEFSDAAFALEVGKVSPVVESQYGFHVIRRDE